MKNFRYCLYIITIIVFSSPFIGAQISTKVEESNILIRKDSVDLEQTKLDTLISTDSILHRDTTKLAVADSVSVDTVPRKKDGLDAQVDYMANDSIVFDFSAGNKGYLYGEAEVHYKEIKLKAENISMVMDSSIVHATYGLDSIGDEFGYPVFSDNGSEYESKSMKYNFKTKKGFSTHTITEQGEGYIVAERAKKNDDDTFFMCDGKYTTCDNHDHPHFYLMLTKAKVRPKKDIITGPAYLVIEDVPLPFVLPFGFFPFTDSYSSGVIMPSYGDEMEKGFGLRDGGYYFAINDYVDLAVKGEVWTRGSWGLSTQSTYRKRYKYSGNVNMNYMVTKYGDKGDNDYSVSKDFRINWHHSQDPKANMYRTISASVDFSTSSYNRNDVSQYYSGMNTQNTKNSSVTITQRFPNSPFTLSANLSASQVSSDTTVALVLPNLTASMSRIYPFKKKDKVGNEKWYEKIQFSYSGDLRNSIKAKESEVFKASLIKDWSNAIKHSIPVSATFNAMNYLNITPSFNYTERWYTRKITQKYDASINKNINADTTYSFSRVYDFNYALSLQTKLYGFYEPLFKIGSLQKIRHVFTPSISYSGRPDFSDPVWGFYERYSYYDANGDLHDYVYSPYSQEIFGTASSGKQGSINFSFDNNFEMKLGTDNDSTKIISLIDNLGIRFSYNMMADSLRWTDISTNMRLKLSKNLTVNVSATFDPYMYDLNNQGKPVKVDKLRIQNGKGFGRLRSTGYSISPSINQDTFKKWFGKDDKKDPDNKPTDENIDGESMTDENSSEEETKKGSLFDKGKEEEGEYDSDGYLINTLKWNLSFQYSFNYAYSDRFDDYKKEYKHRLSHNLGLSGSIQPTKNWNFSFSTSYDFDQKKFAQVNCTLTRNLHCWSLSASFVPVGVYKSYFVSLRANSSMLQDLKYEKRGRTSSFDPEWY